MSYATAAIVVGGAVTSYMGNQSAGRAADAAEAGSERAIAEQRRQFDTIRGDTAPYRHSGANALAALNAEMGFQPMPYYDAYSGGYQAPQPDPAALVSSYDDAIRLENNRDNPDTNRLAELNAMRDRELANMEQARNAPDSGVTLDEQGNVIGPNPATHPTGAGFQASPGYQFRLDQGNRALERRQSAGGNFLSGASLRGAMDYNQGMASQEYGNYWNRLAAMAGLGQTGTNTSANAGMNAANNIGNAFIGAGNARGNAFMQGGAATNNAIQGGISNWMLNNYLTNQQSNQPSNTNAVWT